MKHGAILARPAIRCAGKAPNEPLNYYTRESGIGRAILELQKRRNA